MRVGVARETQFAEALGRRGLVIKEMVGDGACMFRAIAEQIYGDQEMHGEIRNLCMNYMANNQDHFRAFITEDYDAYIQRKRNPNVHGNHVELQAISEMFARPVEVYQYNDEPINVLLPREDPTADPPADGAPPANPPAPQNEQNPPFRLSYHRAVHYNAILAPNVPTIGVGLGLPGMVPGAADKDLLTKALAKSELEHIEETMLQDKIDLTDYQRTQADLEDQIARESLMTYLNDLEKARGEQAGPSEPSTSSATAPSESAAPPVESRGGLYEELLAAQSLEWDPYTDDVAIAEALLVSQQDFLSQQQNKPGPSSDEGPSSSG
uniref:ubiquitinyl hydrolase 1 n=2 Tax=Caenorhabditis tropicalis TaxID=1561998 RepID=A0A1I7UH12_9PELO